MRPALLAVALVFLAAPALSRGTPTVQELLRAEAAATSKCQGSSDELVTSVACPLRDKLYGRLLQAGYCFGRIGQTQAEKSWHKCGAKSIFDNELYIN